MTDQPQLPAPPVADRPQPDWDALNAEQNQHRAEMREQLLAELMATAEADMARRFGQLEDISEDEWATAVHDDAASDITPVSNDVEGKAVKDGDWQTQVGELTRVQTLVHLAYRLDSWSVDEIREQLVRMRRIAYADEITLQAQRVGCRDAVGFVGEGRLHNELDAQSAAEAQGIADTFNRDLVRAIQAIADDVPTANRYTYAARLREWETARNAWKQDQIDLHTETSARSRAQAEFYAHNTIQGEGELIPRTAKCPICQGWIARGKVDLQIALNNPGPFHPNCPHLWETYPEQTADCEALWLGE